MKRACGRRGCVALVGRSGCRRTELSVLRQFFCRKGKKKILAFYFVSSIMELTRKVLEVSVPFVVSPRKGAGGLQEYYYEAAIRHFVDAGILKEEACYDNAVGLYGNSAECALKTLIEGYCGADSRKILKNKYGHEPEALTKDLFYFVANSSATALLDPALGLKRQIFSFPEVLFRGHPERRYMQNGVFTLADAVQCEEAVHALMDEMIKQHIDGYIS